MQIQKHRNENTGAGWVGCKYINTEIKNTGAGWLGGMQIQKHRNENIGGGWVDANKETQK